MKYIIVLLPFLLVSCSALRNSPKYSLQPGYYRESGLREDVYVDLSGDTISMYRENGFERIASFPERPDTMPGSFSLGKTSFDLDLLTIPLKLRPAAADVPPQLEASTNINIYFGMRSDRYSAAYTRSPLGRYERKLSHFGISAGIFGGIGSGTVTPTVTQNMSPAEYEGIVAMGGGAVILAIENFSFGATLGLDYLLDRNSNIWVYHGKPWLGISLGLNLN